MRDAALVDVGLDEGHVRRRCAGPRLADEQDQLRPVIGRDRGGVVDEVIDDRASPDLFEIRIRQPPTAGATVRGIGHGRSS
jgi:hypothetical protein